MVTYRFGNNFIDFHTKIRGRRTFNGHHLGRFTPGARHQFVNRGIASVPRDFTLNFWHIRRHEVTVTRHHGYGTAHRVSVLLTLLVPSSTTLAFCQGRLYQDVGQRSRFVRDHTYGYYLFGYRLVVALLHVGGYRVVVAGCTWGVAG